MPTRARIARPTVPRRLPRPWRAGPAQAGPALAGPAVVVSALLASVVVAPAAVAASPAATAPAPAAVTVRASAAAGSPRVAVTAPGAGARVGVLHLAASASAPRGVAKVVFLVDGHRVAEDATAPFTGAWDSRHVADGRVTLSALAVARGGAHTYSAPVTVTVANRAPVVRLTAPSPGSHAGRVVLAATAAQAAGIASVAFVVDGRGVGVDTTAPYAVAWDSRAAGDRTVTVRAVATSRVATRATSAPARVRLVNTAPRVVLTAPRPGSTSGQVIVAASASSAAGIARVDLLADGRVFASDTTAPFAASWDTFTVPDHRALVTAVATSAAGVRTVSAPVAVTVANGAGRWGDRFGTSAAPRGGIFGSPSFWEQPVGGAPVRPDSAAVVGDLLRQMPARLNGGNASLNVWQYTAQLVTVPAGQRRVTVHWDDCQRKGYTPRGLFGPGGQFEQVPVPDDAVPSAGSDASLSLWSPSADQMWDFWHLRRRPDGWHACWGGRIDAVSRNPGYFAGGFGTSATGIAGIGGMLSIRDVEYGRADHAIAFGIRDPMPWRTFSWPAQRSDGSSGSASLVMEGQRFRLDPRVDVDALHISPIAKIVAHAAQRYGMVVTDKSGTVAIGAESGTFAQRATGTNPWPGYLGSAKSYDVLAGFPWGSLQALPKDYGEPLH